MTLNDDNVWWQWMWHWRMTMKDDYNEWQLMMIMVTMNNDNELWHWMTMIDDTKWMMTAMTDARNTLF